MASDERKYWVKGSWIFNLESMHDKVWCLIYDARDGILKFPIEVAGKKVYDEDGLYDILDEAANLEWKAKSGKVTSKEYGRIKQIVNWRVTARYITCLNAGMSEKEAGYAFEDI